MNDVNLFETGGPRPGLVMRFYRISHWFARGGAVGWPFAKLVHWISKATTAADLDPRAHIHPTVKIPHATGVVIGETASVGARTIILPGVVIGTYGLGETGKRHANVGSEVLIGAGAKILGPVCVGDRARIGANAVVVKDVPPGATAVGVPARVVKITEVPGAACPDGEVGADD